MFNEKNGIKFSEFWADLNDVFDPISRWLYGLHDDKSIDNMMIKINLMMNNWNFVWIWFEYLKTIILFHFGMLSAIKR